MDYSNEVINSGNTEPSPELNARKATKRSRNELEDGFNFQRNYISNLINVTSSNRYTNLSEVLLHDRSVPQPAQTVSKCVTTPKINVITVKTSKKIKLIQTIKDKSQSNFTVSPSGIFTNFHPATAKDYQDIIKVLDEQVIQHFTFLNKPPNPSKWLYEGCL